MRDGGFTMTAKIEGDDPILPTQPPNDFLPAHLRCPKTVEEQERLSPTRLAPVSVTSPFVIFFCFTFVLML